MADMMFALGQTKKKKVEENKVRQTKKDLKDVNITDTIEKDIRKEQHTRDQQWKATGRDQIKKNTNFDMARSLFGGGGPAPPRHDDDEDEAQPPSAKAEEVEEVVQEVERLRVADDDEEQEDYEEQEDNEEEEEEEEN